MNKEHGGFYLPKYEGGIISFKKMVDTLLDGMLEENKGKDFKIKAKMTVKTIWL